MIKKFYLTYRWTLISTATPGQSGPRGNGNEDVLHISQSSKTGESLSDGLVSYPVRGVDFNPLQRRLCVQIPSGSL